jgi:hypothetical protein
MSSMGPLDESRGIAYPSLAHTHLLLHALLVRGHGELGGEPGGGHRPHLARAGKMSDFPATDLNSKATWFGIQ